MTTVSRFSTFDELPIAAKSLFEAAETKSFFLGLPWFQTFVKYALDPGDEIRIYDVNAAAKPHEARIILPVLHRISGDGVFCARRLSSLSSYYTSLFSPVGNGMTDKSVMGALAKTLAGDSPSWDIIELRPLAVDELSFSSFVSGLRAAGFVVQTFFCFGNWYLEVQGRSFDQYLDDLPSTLRNTLARKKKKLEKSGRARLEIVTGSDGLESAIEGYNKVYLASWKRPEPYPLFVPALIRECAARGALRLGILTVDGEPAAAQFWIVQNGKALIYKLAYDERFADLSVGTILTAALMQHAIDVDHVREIDYLTGDDSYKKHWMSARRERWGILAMNPRTLRGSAAIARHVGGRAAKRLVKSMTSWCRPTVSRRTPEPKLDPQIQG